VELKTDTPFSTDNNSLITRASQILVLFIALGLAGMIASILVSENINDSAAKINMVGSLRMLAARIPFSPLADGVTQPATEVKNFQNRLDIIHKKSQANFKSDTEFAVLFNKIETRWAFIKKLNASLDERTNFAIDLDNLVSYFQQKVEKEVRLLRLIQYFGFFAVLLISCITIYRLQGSLISPFKLLVQVAKEAGRGNFTLHADEKAKGELGLLATSLNKMSQQLSLTYQDLELNVAHKTAALEKSNSSLSILYRTAHNLASREQHGGFNRLLSDLELTLGDGTIAVHLTEQHKPSHNSLPYDKRTNQHLYPIDKHGQSFGTLIWTTHLAPSSWQNELLKAMTNLIATSVDLEHKRRSESLLEIMEERAVIARELHDSLAQSLSYLKLQISLLNKQYQKGLTQEQTSPTINEISRGTNLAYKQLREILTTFRLKLDNDSIENSIQEAVSEFSEKCHYIIEFNCTQNNNALNPHQEIHLLQIIREALSNIHKHAQASAATVNFLIENGEVQIEITDNGCGLPETTSKEGHFGLKIMKERAKSLDGNLHFSQNNPCGTRISLHFKTNSDN